jgi:hypothetical protein
VTYLVGALRQMLESPGEDSRCGHGLNLSDHTMALGSTQLLTEMSAKAMSWRVKATGA